MVPTDIEIAADVAARPIAEIAERLGLPAGDLIAYGPLIAKVPLAVLGRPRQRPRPARLILVSAITPTPAGEGKTTTSIGLAQGLARIRWRRPSCGGDGRSPRSTIGGSP